MAIHDCDHVGGASVQHGSDMLPHSAQLLQEVFVSLLVQ